MCKLIWCRNFLKWFHPPSLPSQLPDGLWNVTRLVWNFWVEELVIEGDGTPTTYFASLECFVVCWAHWKKATAVFLLKKLLWDVCLVSQLLSIWSCSVTSFSPAAVTFHDFVSANVMVLTNIGYFRDLRSMLRSSWEQCKSAVQGLFVCSRQIAFFSQSDIAAVSVMSSILAFALSYFKRYRTYMHQPWKPIQGRVTKTASDCL